VRCQSEDLAHHASTLAAARRAVNGKSDLNELRAEIAELRALLDTKASKSKIKTKLVTFVTDNVPLVAILRPTDGTMAATNKCLALSNKSPDCNGG
jgi:hypothetical protein